MKSEKKLINKMKKALARETASANYNNDSARKESESVKRVNVLFDWAKGMMTIVQ